MSPSESVDGFLCEEGRQDSGHDVRGDDVSLPVERVPLGLWGGIGYRLRGSVEEVVGETGHLRLGDETLAGH